MKNYVIYIFTGIGGLIMLTHFLINEYENNKIRSSNKLISGIVERVEETSGSGVRYKYTVGFKVNNIRYWVSNNYHTASIEYNKGDSIDVLYQSSNPKNAIFKEDLYSPFILFEFIIDLIVSLVLFVGIYQYKKLKTGDF